LGQSSTLFLLRGDLAVGIKECEPMRIGFDARLVYYRQAGIGQYILHLVQGLARLMGPNRQGEGELWVFRSHKAPALDLPEWVHQAGLWTPSHHRFESAGLTAELAGKRLSLLHSPDFIPPFSGGFRSVITIHDLNFIHFPEFLTPESEQYYGQIHRAVERADHIIVDSNWTRQDVIKELGVSPERVSTVYLAANPVYRPITDLQEVRRAVMRYGLPNDFIIFVGTLEPRKNVPTLLRALGQLRDEGYGVHLAVVGRKGWLYEDIFATLTDLKLADYVHFLENVPNKDLVRLYNAARCLALPSHYEGFGLPPLEAMACGTPVVVSNRASLPEVVGEAGLLVDPDRPEALSAALARVLSDHTLRASLSQRGMIRANAFSWARAADETLAVYRQVLQKETL
jgi:glycosyltransferase involved in cell wall biosynthesis